MIQGSIDYCKEQGIEIRLGSIFSLIGRGYLARPVSCDWAGAIMIKNGLPLRFYPGWLKEVAVDILGKDTYWFWRYNYGFNQGRVLDVWREEGGKRIYYEDEVSKEGLRLAKRNGLYAS